MVNDGKTFNSTDKEKINQCFKNINYILLENRYKKGLGGSLNTGLKYLISSNFNGYVSILDDDDTWDEDHLKINYDFAKLNNADVVISGLRMIKNGIDSKRKFPNSLTANDFLKGNPGWQGSNSFISIEILKKVKGFRNGLLSTNDRDIAFRILNVPKINIVYTENWTANWFFESDANSLSIPRSDAKILGLQWFWYIYKDFFNKEFQKAFFKRANEYFGIKEEEIKNIKYKPTNRTMIGDLDV